MAETLTDVSREAFTVPTRAVAIEQINCGSLQRIAAATEVMAMPYQTLIQERDLYKSRLEESDKRDVRKNRQIAALRGQITKLKKRINS